MMEICRSALIGGLSKDINIHINLFRRHRKHEHRYYSRNTIFYQYRYGLNHSFMAKDIVRWTCKHCQRSLIQLFIDNLFSKRKSGMHYYLRSFIHTPSQKQWRTFLCPAVVGFANLFPFSLQQYPPPSPGLDIRPSVLFHWENL